MRKQKSRLFLFACAVFVGLSVFSRDDDHGGVFFTENKGQICDQNNMPRLDVSFSGCVKDLVFYLRNDGISYQFYKAREWSEVDDHRSEKTIKNPSVYDVCRLDLNWVNVN